VKGPVRDILDRHQVFEWLPRKNFFLNVDLAISYLDNKTAKSLPNPEKVDSKDIPPI
jgi:hypothetical protein